MSASWNDVEHAVYDDTIDSLSKERLIELSKVEPPNNNNPGLIAKAQHAQQRILRRLYEIEDKEREQREAAKFTTSIRWGKIAGYAAILGVVLMIVQILISIGQWYTSKKHDSPPAQSQEQNIQQPTKSRASLSSSSSSSTQYSPKKKSKQFQPADRVPR